MVDKKVIFDNLYDMLDGYDLDKDDLVSLFNDFTNDYTKSKDKAMWDEIEGYRDDFLSAFTDYINLVLTYAGDEKGVDDEIVSQMEADFKKIEKAMISNQKTTVNRKDISDFSDNELQKILRYIATI